MEERIKTILCEVKEDHSLMDNLCSSSDIINEVGLDSLQMINFILRVEDEFGIEIDFENFDISQISSIGTFCNYISRCVSGI